MDGCRAGWIALWLTKRAPRKTGAAVFASMTALWTALGHAEHILVDMPIGLPHRLHRHCDSEARQILGPRRGSRVFPCPSRAALEARAYPEACKLNLKQLGKKLSKQSYFILPKIRECDALLQGNAAAREKIVEAHPEVCFAGLVDGAGLASSKKTEQGRDERLALIQDNRPELLPVVQAILAQHRRSELLPDDAVDAAMLTYAASVPGRWRVLPEQVPLEFDETGLPMRIVGLKSRARI
ncbi:MAG: DUF429 domain-containing protein [Opitutales bacterium]